MTYSLISIGVNNNSFNKILIIIDFLTKIVQYKLFKAIIDIIEILKVIINIVIRY